MARPIVGAGSTGASPATARIPRAAYRVRLKMHGSRTSRFVIALVTAMLALDAGATASRGHDGGEPAVDFGRHVLPIFATRCFTCHGPDDAVREAGLRLDLRESAIAELESGATAIVPGKPDGSELLRRITSDDVDVRMPPPDAGDALTPLEIDQLRRWIAEGATYTRHWSFLPPVAPPLPDVHDSSWPRTAVDRFVLAKMEQADLYPSSEANRYWLIRRVSLDLTGLPPTLDEVDAFVHDRSPVAYERLVDRLLASPAFGERWARVWLDLARYADSAGYANDPPRTIWKYRDWVISAVSANEPFDEFTIEQIAGDLLPQPTTSQRIATAFHRNTLTNSEGGTDDEEFRSAAVVDRVNTTMQVWMGTTIGCAQCHSHKYDPFTQREYYELFAIFNNTEDADHPSELPTLATPTPAEQKEMSRLRREIQRLQQPAAESAAESAAQPAAQSDKTKTQRLATLKKRLAAIRPVTTPIMRELAPDHRRTTHIHIRGNFLDSGEEVHGGVPAIFHPLPAGASADRLSLARWLVDLRNPLTARVAVNRYWEQLFGRGLVETAEDFGTQGTSPSHPELLDWLATTFMELGWDTKALLRIIVTSATYRQSSRSRPQLDRHDPSNILLARGPRVRLSAEMIRDQALAIGGLLSQKMYGPSVRPPRPVLGLKAAFGKSTDWESSEGEDRYRRGLYTTWRRTIPYPSMAAFDAPSREVCTVRRINTNTPLQALVTLNDPVFVEAAQGLARRIIADGGDSLAERVRYGFRLCLSRPPSPQESAVLATTFLEAHRKFSEDPQMALDMATAGPGPPAPQTDSAELAAWTVVGNVLLNLDETLSKP